ncbi:unnamed protein product, partial [Brassica oleracea]
HPLLTYIGCTQRVNLILISSNVTSNLNLQLLANSSLEIL